MPTNFKNKIRSAVIVYEIYPTSITKCSVKFFADIYCYLFIALNLTIIIVSKLIDSIVNSSAASAGS